MLKDCRLGKVVNRGEMLMKMAVKLAALAALVACIGCANGMAIKKKTQAQDIAGKTIALFTYKVANNVKTDYDTTVDMMRVRNEATGKRKTYDFRKPILRGPNWSEYLVSFEMPEPGTYRIDEAMGESRNFWIGQWFFGIDTVFSVPAGKLTYIGHLDMSIRHRMEGEEMAGALLPLISQEASGMTKGTFDIVVEDREESDMKWFVDTFPCLEGMTVEKSMMKIDKPAE